MPLGSKPTEVTENLYAQEINVLAEIQEHWGDMQAYVGTVLSRQGMSKPIAEELAIIPGMEEVVSLIHINRQATEGNFDCVIVDAAPTGETMRLLTMPETFQWYMQRFTGWGDATTKLATGLIRRLMPSKDPLGGLNSLVDGVKELQKTLLDPKTTSYRVVLNPEKMVMKEAARAVTYLSLFGYPVDGVVINRILPGLESDGQGNAWVATPSADPYLAQLQKAQAQYLGDIERDFHPLPLLYANWSDQEVVGVERLAPLAESLFSERRPDEVFFTGQTQYIEEDGEDYVLKLPLPHVELEKVKLAKRGDELFVSIGNFKRELLLPSVLAQRNAGNARFDNGVLQVRFPPFVAEAV